jgi:hopene-associated glycosyltransferase HpnB
VLLAASLPAAAAWAGLVFLRGGFWRATLDDHFSAEAPDSSAIRVEAVVPARNEASVVGPAIASLLEQRGLADFRVTLVDDGSDDGTADAARSAASGTAREKRFSIAAARELAPGWTGKIAALERGVQTVLDDRGAPDFWLFTDADILHDPQNVAAILSKAESEGLDLASLMVRLHCTSVWERLLIPAFVFFFQKLYPFSWSNDPKRSTAAAAGGCILLRNSALERIGGLAAIRDALIDDCALAAKVKRGGGRTWLGLSERTASNRAYDGLPELWRMVKRSAFTQLNRSYAMVAVTVASMSLLYVVPPVATVAGLARRDGILALSGASAWLLMTAAYLPTVRAYRLPPAAALTLPLAAVLYTVMTVDSAVAHARKRGGSWKNRSYAFGGDTAPGT